MSETLTHGERLRRTLRRRPVDRLPDYEFGTWPQTIYRWREEGLTIDPPPWETDPNGPWWGESDGYHGRYDMDVIDEVFGTDRADFDLKVGMGISTGLYPAFEMEVVEERGDHQVMRDEHGALVERIRPELGMGIPRTLRHAVESRADWERLRDERLNPDTPGRIPGSIDTVVAMAASATSPVHLRGSSLYGWIRNWMGVERVSMTFYDDPAWIEEMMDHLVDLLIAVVEPFAGRLQVDFCSWWEDMAYKAGPLISPSMFERFMVPRYKRATDFLREAVGCEYNAVDSDGNVHALVAGWAAGGLNLIYPLEPAHTDVLQIAGEQGDRICYMGGFDKRTLAAGPEAIDKEFARLQSLFELGGYIPYLDHFVPPDVSLDNYLYYRRRKCDIIGKEWQEPAAVSGRSRM